MRPLIPSAAPCGLALVLAACSQSSDVSLPSGRFVFRETQTADVVRLEIRNPEGLEQAEILLESGEERFVIGTPRRGDAGFNAPWSWNLDPASIEFAAVTIEACQTLASGVEEDLDYWLRFGQVCLWGIVETRER